MQAFNFLRVCGLLARVYVFLLELGLELGILLHAALVLLLGQLEVYAERVALVG